MSSHNFDWNLLSIKKADNWTVHNHKIRMEEICLKKEKKLKEVKVPVKDTKERNKKITIAVLEGFTLQQMADRYKLTRERIRQIVYKLLLKCDKKSINDLKTLKEIREYDYYFVNLLERR